MIIANLNLLSPFKKERLEKLVRFIFIKNILETALFIFALAAIALLWSWLLLVDEFNSLSQSSLIVNRTYSAYNQQIKQVNRLIRDINLASDSYLPLSLKILEFAKKLPPDIKLSAIELDRRAGTLILSGTAATRDGFLNWQETLRGVDWLMGVEIPASQLFQKENVGFQIKARLKNFE